MKKKVTIIIICVSLLVIFAGVFPILSGYTVSFSRSFVPYEGSVDVYTASKEELTRQSFCGYATTFGKVNTRFQAAKIVSEMVVKIYGEGASPYVVKFNKNADAWIVSGSKPLFGHRGIATIAIPKHSNPNQILEQKFSAVLR